MYKYKILTGSQVFFFHFIHDLPFSPKHLLESEERIVNLFCDFSPLCGASVCSRIDKVEAVVDFAEG